MEEDPKSQLMKFMQRKIKRTPTKEDYSFSIEKFDEGCQATLYMTCLGDGMEFVGEVGRDAKEAEKLAARQAIANYAEEIEALEVEYPRLKAQKKLEKRKAQLQREEEGQEDEPKRSRQAPPQAPNTMANAEDEHPKNRLNRFLTKFLGRPISKGDQTYDVVKYNEGFQATLTLDCLEGDVFVGEVAPSIKEAERNAAAIAIESYYEQVLEVESLPVKKKGEKGDIGKGCKPQQNGVKGGCYPEPPSYPPCKGKGGFGKWQGAVGPQPMLMPYPSLPYKGGWRPYAMPMWDGEQQFMKGSPYGKPVAPMCGKPTLKGNAMMGKGTVAPFQMLPQREIPQDKPHEAYKSKLNTFLQRFLGRPVVKGDMESKAERLEEDRWQATLTLHSLEAEVYVAEAETEKEAVELAAKSALDAHAADMQALPPSGGNKKKKPKDPLADSGGLSVNQIPLGGTGMEAEEARALDTAMTPKSSLNTFVMKLIRRSITKGEIVYESSEVDEGGYQAVVTISCVSGPDSENMWTGEVCKTKQEAEQSAAELAFAILSEVPEHIASLQEREAIKAQERIKQARERNEKKGKGKGKGKFGTLNIGQHR